MAVGIGDGAGRREETGVSMSDGWRKLLVFSRI